ncbi:hypothetical protein GCM10007416_34110 [Kroppenstedtia guangzhouensis]|uniref:DUF4829 domain-containing protein n=1 Tax=Kroppenstedtia guangzhouensis TaxID=1274356 RepID=A0ABQ1H441_9BACL|nr:hypothetical protein [Kroppenstedtia guangzhouensis]GGA58086.1 hypothetical protein GCM10007416_34110 [Kroppenstedtia guangzhouensis]
MKLKQLVLVGALFLPLFFGVGVVASYLFSQWSSSKPQAISTPPAEENPLPPSPDPQPEEIPEMISDSDREEAQKVALEFLPAYLSFSPKKADVFVEKYQHLITDQLQEEIQKEPKAKPLGLKVLETEAMPLDQLEDQPENEMSWHIWVTIEKGKSGKYELAYLVALVKEAGEWRVKGLRYIEYPDAE